MKALTLICLSLFVATAAAESIDRRVDAAPDGVVTISNIAGSVGVTGWSREQVEVTGELGKNVEELIVARDGNEVEITVKVPKSGDRSISSDLIVKLPEGSSLKVVGVSADIDVDNVFGTLDLQSVSGDIDSEIHEADAEIVTVSGDIDVQGDDREAYAKLSTVSGDIDAQHLAGEVTAKSVSGDLVLVNSSLDRASLDTTNGDMVFNAELASDGRLGVTTINGDLDVMLKGSVTARFDIETFNGTVRNCFGPEPVRSSKYAPGTELKFREGNGKGLVKIKTLNGDIRLCKE